MANPSLIFRFFCRGFTLTELLVSLVILSILASVALPYAEVSYTRSKEIRLMQNLREIRRALDRFYEDCAQGLIVSGQDGVSENCYPESLAVLVDGVDSNDAEGALRFYLRRIPKDPFADATDDPEDHWAIRGYRDELDGSWSGDDVFDIQVQHELIALDGSEYQTW